MDTFKREKERFFSDHSGIWVYDPHTQKEEWSETLEQVLGDIPSRQPENEIRFFRYFPELKQIVETMFAQRLASKNIELSAGKQTQCFFFLVDVQYDDSGQPIQVTVFIRLQKSHSTFPKSTLSGFVNLISHIPGSIVFATDSEGRYTLLDGSGLEHLEITPEEWVGRSIFDFLKDYPDRQKVAQRVLQGETIVDYSCFANHHFEDHLSPVYDDDGIMLGIVGVQINITAKVRAENELKNSIELLDNLFDGIPYNTYALDPNFKILRANHAAQVMFPNIPLLDSVCFEAIHGRETPCDFCPVVETYRTGDPKTRVYFDENLNKFFELTSFPIRDQITGQIVGATEMAQDITDRKRIEESLLRNQTMLNELWEGLDEVVYLIDKNYTILQANKMMGKMYPELLPLVGRKCYDTTTYGRICPDCAAEYTFREGKRTSRTFFEKNSEDEPGYWFELTTFPIYDTGSDEITSVLGIMRNVTPRVELESQLDEYRLQLHRVAEQQTHDLRLSETKLRTILETSGAAISFADYRGRFTYVNGMFKEMLGYSEEESYGRHMASFMLGDAEILAQRAEEIQQALNGKTDRYRTTCSYKAKDGRTIWGDVNVSVIRGTRPEDTQLISVIVDITAQQQMVEYLNQAKIAAEEASLAKSQFLATMSHEIRTPLNGVIGVSNLLMETPLQPKQLEYAGLIKASGESLLFLINDILDFSKIEAGKFELEKSEFIVHELVESVVGILASKTVERRLELIATFDAQVPGPVIGDMGRLRQILINLVSNALKFTETGGVRIHVAFDGIMENSIRLKFSVKDTGIGIARDRQNRLFKSFSQVDASAARIYGGTGLGLAISKKLVELMGGEIHVESTVGEGSVFWFTACLECIPLVLKCLKAKEYPCVTEKRDYCRGIPPHICARSGREVAYLQRVAELRGVKALIVSDGAIKVPALLEQMQSWNMQAQAASTLNDATQLLEKANKDGVPFRLIIVDFPTGSTEIEPWIRNIQDDDRFSKIAFVGIAPLSEDLRRKTWKSPEKIRFVSKPVCCSFLLDAMIRLLYVLPKSPCLPETPPSETLADKTDTTPIKAIRILVAEDNRINQIVISEILKKADMECTVVENGLQVIDQLRSSTFDIVLMDCQMPLMDGYEATRKIRLREEEFPHSAKLPIIALTANATSEDEGKCLSAGMDAYCSKPIETSKLLNLIRQFSEK